MVGVARDAAGGTWRAVSGAGVAAVFESAESVVVLGTGVA